MGILVFGFVFGLIAATAVAVLEGAFWLSVTAYVLVGLVAVPISAVVATAIVRMRQTNATAMKKPIKPGQAWSI